MQNGECTLVEFTVIEIWALRSQKELAKPLNPKYVL